MIEILYSVSLPKPLTLRLNARFRKILRFSGSLGRHKNKIFMSSSLPEIKRLAPLFFHKKKSGYTLPQHLAIIFVSPKYSQTLNKRYRKKSYVPNVLSFLYDDSHGEIFITPSVVKKEAKKSGESLEIALVKMAVHGIIHCSGVDHESSVTEGRIFEALEQKLFEQAYGVEHGAYRNSKR